MILCSNRVIRRQRDVHGRLTSAYLDGARRAAFTRGFQAQRNGVRDDACPYVQAHLMRWWLRGWDFAYEHAADADTCTRAAQ